MFMQKVFSKVNLLQTVSNQEVTLTKLIIMLRIAKKLYIGALSDLCINSSYNNVAKGNRLLLKKHFFI